MYQATVGWPNECLAPDISPGALNVAWQREMSERLANVIPVEWTNIILPDVKESANLRHFDGGPQTKLVRQPWTRRLGHDKEAH
jgi:hypothetical protein